MDLLLDDVVPGSEDEERLRLLRQTAVELKGSLRAVLRFARPAKVADPARADLAEAARSAIALVRYGTGRSLVLEERFSAEPQLVACPEPLVVQAALHLLVAARAAGRVVTVIVENGALSVSPAGSESVGELIASRIAAAHGGSLDRTRDAVTVRFRI